MKISAVHFSSRILVAGLLLSGASLWGAAPGDGSSSYSESTKTVVHDTDVYLPLGDGTVLPETPLASLLGRYPSGGRAGFTLARALPDASVQTALTGAKQNLVNTGGSAFIGYSSGVIAGEPVYVGSQVVNSTVSYITTAYIGPQTIMTGEGQTIPLVIPAGAVDYDTLVSTNIFRNQVYQLTGTTVVSDLPGLALIGTTSDGLCEVVDAGPVYSLSESAAPVALYLRRSILSAAAAGTRDVNNRLYRLRTERERPDDTPYWSGYVAGNIAAQTSKAAGYAPAFSTDAFTGTVGTECNFFPNLYAGAALSVVSGHSSLGELGKADLSGWEASGYFSWKHTSWYVDGLYGIGLFHDDLKRNTLLGQTAQSNPHAFTQNYGLNAGYNVFEGLGWNSGLYVGMSYTFGRIYRYSESDVGPADVTVGAQKFESLLTDVGWQGSWALAMGGHTFRFQLRSAWERETLSDERTLHLALIESPYLLVDPAGGWSRTGAYTSDVREPSYRDDYWVVGGGVGVELSSALSLMLDYEGHFLRAANRQQFGSLGGQYKF